MRLLPAYPLFVKDPYFSLWSADEILNGSDVVFWHGETKRIYGTVEADGKKYSFLGNQAGMEKLNQTKITITAFSTIYSFECADFEFTAEFVSPLPPDNVELLSCPCCYLLYKTKTKKKIDCFKVSLALGCEVCYDTSVSSEKKQVRRGVINCGGYETAFCGLARQSVMSCAGDEGGADWGYYYIAGDGCALTGENDDPFISAVNEHNTICDEVNGKFIVAFDDTLSIFYYGDWLKGYYFKDGKTILDAINYSITEITPILESLDAFDGNLKKQAASYGDDYLHVLYASLRQAVAAHKLVEDKLGRKLFLSKECNSGGCIATADVTYPSMPLFLLYNPELVQGMIYPILDMARKNVWEYDYAPHDAGMYPYCMGQSYAISTEDDKYHKNMGYFGKVGVNDETLPMYYMFPRGSNLYNERFQMPVEECGNMLIISAAIWKYTNNKNFLKENFDLLSKWADYLLKKGLVPSDQLCTDDFAGHLDKNVNLGMKTCVALAAFSIICKALGKNKLSEKFEKTAKEFAAECEDKAFKDNHFILAYDGGSETFSIKYNMLFDIIFGANLFDCEKLKSEVDFYLSKMNYFGTPLDSRKMYTKSDWLLWAAGLTGDKEKAAVFISSVSRFLKESPDRVPFADWYESDSGKYNLFRNRTVQGAAFILLLKN